MTGTGHEKDNDSDLDNDIDHDIYDDTKSSWTRLILSIRLIVIALPANP